ncbi:MAG: ATP-binding protein [Gammaproteobacteria bacterium]|jgi:signal transduction histidine kinase
MIRSNFAITRLILLPYAALLVLYFLVVVGGGAWLYQQMRTAETRLLINDILQVIEPLAGKLGSVDALASMERDEPWLVAYVRDLFTDLPPLRTVSVRNRERGLEMNRDAGGTVVSRDVMPLPADARRASSDAPATERLYAESEGLFLIRFDLSPAGAPPVRLDFGFDRLMMVSQIDESLSAMGRAILWFAFGGGVSILLATGITVTAMRVTRRVEGHFQELYQRAAITEMAAELVHELRNPLMALRANVRALLVTPEQTQEIVSELDRDIVTLNDKLNAFLSLARQNDDRFEPVDIRGLVQDAVRLADPVLAQHGLTVEPDIPPELPRAMLQRAAIRDALLNVVLNAAQSGQRDGAIRISAREQDGFLTITVDDRGDGIPDEHLPHLFDPYYTTRAGGNGLGLAIVQRNVAAHRGQVRAANRAEGGARIELRLPVQQQEVPRWWKTLKKISPT